MAKEIFISYSRKDFEKVKAIKNEIDSELGIKCWMDLDGIESGEQFENKIIAAIKDHDTMLFMLSTNSMNSPYALKELKFAQLKKKRVVLVYIESCEMSDEFLFNYSMYDTIEWSNPLQHDKLLMNLRKWFGGTQQPKPTTNEPTDPEEQFRLGEYYHYSVGDLQKAEYWFRKSAKQGNAKAQYVLSFIYYHDGPISKVKRLELTRKAAEAGYARAQFDLAETYYYGDLELGLLPYGFTHEESIKWYKKAAEQGHEKAQYMLGICYRYGNAVKFDKLEAIKWFKMAANQGNKEAIKELKKMGVTI